MTYMLIAAAVAAAGMITHTELTWRKWKKADRDEQARQGKG